MTYSYYISYFDLIMNQKTNQLGLDISFMDEQDPYVVFRAWMEAAKQSEPNDPNALALATADSSGQPDVRMVLLKGLSDQGFVIYTNLESKKSKDLIANPKASMCFHWKSLLRQVRISGTISQVSATEADAYFQSRPYLSRIGAWASIQSTPMNARDDFEKRIEHFKQTYPDEHKVPRPPFWSGWLLSPVTIEFWKDVSNRLHQRLRYSKVNHTWKKEVLYP
jgi:pyridoxamine 5'-phosphate oxidase